MSSNEAGEQAPHHDRHKIVRARVRAGKSQNTVANEAGISAAHLCNVENGKRNPSPEVLAALARVLGCTVADFEPDPIEGGDDVTSDPAVA